MIMLSAVEHRQFPIGAIAPADDLALRLETEAAERELATLEREQPDLVGAMDYVLDVLSPDARAAFEARLAADPATHALVERLTHLRDSMRSARDRAVTDGEPAARRAVVRVQHELEREEGAAQDDRAPGAPDPATSSTQRAAAARAQRIGRWTVAILRYLSIVAVAILVLSLFGPWSPLVPTWRVMRDREAAGATYRLRLGTTAYVMGGHLVAERAPGAIDAEGWFARVQELYIDATFIDVFTRTVNRIELRLETPLVTVHGQGASFRVEGDSHCTLTVTARDGFISVRSRRFPDGSPVVVHPGNFVRTTCEGRLLKPGELPPAPESRSGSATSSSNGRGS